MTQNKKKSNKPLIQNAHNARKVPAHHRYVTETIGWFGAIAVLLAYGLANFNLVSVHSVLYQVLNLAGAGGILTIATAKHVRQSMVVNAFWGLMAVIALAQIIIFHI